jgi:tetratricopeptide (TPR) repeat protein
VSQSPIDPSSAGNKEDSQVKQYQSGWSKLNELLRRGGSLSGREQNCCYLNLGASAATSFADVSHAVGFDATVDGRGLALSDWDRDGDLDVWLSNRTGPRIQYIKNESKPTHRFVSLSLQGIESNRDAIGARVEIEVEPPVGVLSRTVTAGDAYLSQSSKTLHFGLGEAKRITHVRVRWPGTREFEAVNGVDLDGEFRIVEGTFDAIRSESAASTGIVEPQPVTTDFKNERNKMFVVGRLPLPPITAEFEGLTKGLIKTGQPTIVLLWAAHCPVCIEELSRWSRHSEKIRTTGAEVVALSAASGLASHDNESLEQTRKAIEESKFPYAWGMAQASQLELIEAYLGFLQSDFQRPLQVPMSLLVDRHGQVAVVYRGAISVDEVLEDLSVLAQSPAKLRQTSLPFQGRWIRPMVRPSPTDLASRLSERFGPPVATAYFEHMIQLADQARQKAGPTNASDPYAISTIWVGQALHSLGTIALAEGRFADAANYSHRAGEFIPDDFRLYSNLGAALSKLGRPQEALAAFNKALVLRPDRPSVLVNRATTYSQMNRHSDAIRDWEALLRIDPDDERSRLTVAALAFAIGDDQRAVMHYSEQLGRNPQSPDASGALAWILATSHDANVRDGERAVTLATKWLNHSHGQNYKALNALAAAFAECGEFTKATAAIDRAITLAGRNGDNRAITAYRNRRDMYLMKTPFRRQKRPE